MATFTYAPSYAIAEQSQPRVRTVQFGDGYSQRLRYGLNTDAKVWNLRFEIRTDSETTTITDFLEARAGAESFDWTPPRGDAGKYICTDWSVDMVNYNNNSITATFVQVFEP